MAIYHSNMEIPFKKKPEEWIQLTIPLTEEESKGVIDQLVIAEKQYAIQKTGGSHPVLVWTGKY